jgi:hypothetical protein
MNRKPPTLAVEDYLKRTVKSKSSVKLTTFDPFNRVGSVIIYRGELWSARDSFGVGEFALFRLMNARVFLHVEPLSELDRGPRNITESRHVLFMRASFESQAALDVGDNSARTRSPRAEAPVVGVVPDLATRALKTWVAPPKPSRKLESLDPVAFPDEAELPTLVAPASTAWLTPNDPVVPAIEEQQSKRAPTTLQPLTLEPSIPSTRPLPGGSGDSDVDAHRAAPRRSPAVGWRLPWQAVAIVVLGAGVAVVSSVVSSPTGDLALPSSGSPGAVRSPAEVNAASPVAEASVGVAVVVSHDGLRPRPSEREATYSGSAAPSALGASASMPPGKVVARVREISSAHVLGNAELPRYVYSISGQFMRCYDWATTRAERDGLGKVSVTVRLNADGVVDSAVATGAKVRGLNSCIADVGRRLPELMRLPKAPNQLNWVVSFEHE